MKPPVLGTIGQAIVDIICQADDMRPAHAAFARVGITPQPHQHISEEVSQKIRAALPSDAVSTRCGGSAINSILAYRLAGGSARAFVRLGNDSFALEYAADLRAHSIDPVIATDPDRATGHSIILSCPKSGRSMATCLSAANHFYTSELASDFVTGCDALLMEGYMLALNSREPLEFYQNAASLGKRTVLSLSAPWIVSTHRERAIDAMAVSEIVFANEEEAQALTGMSDPAENVSRIADLCQSYRSTQQKAPGSTPTTQTVIVTAGAQGAFFGDNNTTSHVPAAATSVVDVTGAGDAFAGGFLYLYLHGASVEQSAQGAADMAAAVISQVGGRLTEDSAKKWKRRWGNHTDIP